LVRLNGFIGAPAVIGVPSSTVVNIRVFPLAAPADEHPASAEPPPVTLREPRGSGT